MRDGHWYGFFNIRVNWWTARPLSKSFIHGSGSVLQLHTAGNPHVTVCCCPGKFNEMAPTLDLLLQRINSAILETQLISHDSAMIGTNSLRICTCWAIALSWNQQGWPSPKGQGQTYGEVDRRQWPFWSTCSQIHGMEEGPCHRVSDADSYCHEWTG